MQLGNVQKAKDRLTRKLTKPFDLSKTTLNVKLMYLRMEV